MMDTITLDSGDKKFIFKFSFSPTEPLPTPRAKNNIKGTDIETVTDDDDDSDTPEGPYLELMIYRKDRPKLYFKWFGYLTAQKKIFFSVPVPEAPVITTDKKTGMGNKNQPIPKNEDPPTKPDHNRCEGEFHMYQNRDTGERLVWFDVQFGNHLDRVYEGCMVEIPVDDN